MQIHQPSDGFVPRGIIETGRYSFHFSCGCVTAYVAQIHQPSHNELNISYPFIFRAGAWQKLHTWILVSTFNFDEGRIWRDDLIFTGNGFILFFKFEYARGNFREINDGVKFMLQFQNSDYKYQIFSSFAIITVSCCSSCVFS